MLQAYNYMNVNTICPHITVNIQHKVSINLFATAVIPLKLKLFPR